jgi:hypothetical protein
MDNKYALGSTKVATEHHEAVNKTAQPAPTCKFCDAAELVYCPTMQDYKCSHCDEWQMTAGKGYALGRSSDY